ncbi:MAG TPA: hypothetical protein VGD74_09670 [Vulgatibacter sp.]
MHKWILALALVVAGALWACGSEEKKPAENRPIDQTEVKKEIGAEGGRVEHPSGAAVVIPEGALERVVEISVQGIDAPAGAPGVAVGQGFLLGPEGTLFLVPVDVVVPFDAGIVSSQKLDASKGQVFIAPRGSSDFEALETIVDLGASRLVGKTTHFSQVVPMMPTADPGAGGSGGSGASGGTGGDGGTGGAGGSGGTGGSGGSPVDPPAEGALADVIAYCAWHSTCVEPVVSPLTNCIAAWREFILKGHGSHASNGFADAIECANSNPSSCGEYTGCLAAKGRIRACEGRSGQFCEGDLSVSCHRDADWGDATDCTALGTTCAGSACAPVGPCEEAGWSCTDSTQGTRCTFIDGELQNLPFVCADGQRCVDVQGHSPGCTYQTFDDCEGMTRSTCEGDIQVACAGGVETRTDCSLAGMTCNGRVCDRGNQAGCLLDSCDGDSLEFCLNGEMTEIDCSAVVPGATCAMDGMSANCRLP